MGAARVQLVSGDADDNPKAKASNLFTSHLLALTFGVRFISPKRIC